MDRHPFPWAHPRPGPQTIPPLPAKPQRPRQELRTYGTTPGDPIVCGEIDDGLVPQLVVATGLTHGVRKGQQRWVVGHLVAPAITNGSFIVVQSRPPDAAPPRLTRLADGTPGYAATLPTSEDQWPIAFTVCHTCKTRPAAPGTDLCPECTADLAAAGETPLQKALRVARS